MYKAKAKVISILGMAILLVAMVTPSAVFAQSNTTGWIYGTRRVSRRSVPDSWRRGTGSTSSSATRVKPCAVHPGSTNT